MSLAAAEKARLTPDAMALADERQTLTWSQIDPILNRGANGLLAERPPITRIAVYAHNSVETVLAHLIGLHAGVSTVPANFHFTTDELVYILQDSGAKIVFTGPESVATAKAAAEQVGGVKVIAWRSPPTEGVIPWDAWLAASSEAEPPTDMPPQPHLHYTSGTTGRPKGVETPPTMFPRKATVRELFETLKANSAAMGDRSPSMAVSPLYHTGPLGSVRALGGGTSMAIMSRFDAEKVLETIEKFKVKSTLMVPTHFQRLLALPEEVRRKYDVSSMQVLSHTGAACPRDVKRAMIEWFGPVLTEAYGATESGSTGFLVRLATVNHSSGLATAVRSALSRTSLIPCQNEPNTSQGAPCSSITRLGSMVSAGIVPSDTRLWTRNCVAWAGVLVTANASPAASAAADTDTERIA